MASLSSILRSTAFAAVATLSCVPAFAAVVYSNQAVFSASVQSGFYSENFNDDLGQRTAPAFSFLRDGFGYTVTTAPVFGNEDDVYRSGMIIGSFHSNTELILTFTSGSPTAIGGNFFLTNDTDSFVPGSITFTLSDGTNTTISPASASAFTGFIASTAITSLTFAISATGQFNSIDNLIVGRAIVPRAVPEPATYALLAGGLMALALTKRRRRS